MLKYSVFFSLLMFTLLGQLQAQVESFKVPTTNSHANLRQRLGATDIEVSYSRPSVKGRVIFGGLVPYGQVLTPVPKYLFLLQCR